MKEDCYWDGLLNIVCMYKENKEVVRSLIKTSDVIVSILTSVYFYLVSRKEIDPIESTNKKVISYYLLEII